MTEFEIFTVSGDLGNSIVGGGTTTAKTTAGEDTATTQETGGGFGLLPMLLIYAVIFGAMYFFLFRPQRKQQKKMAEMQDSLKIGDSVVTTSGLFGKIVELGTDAHVLEFGSPRGIRVAVRKSDIQGVKEPVLTPPIQKS